MSAGEEDFSSLGRVAPLPPGSSLLHCPAEGWRGVSGAPRAAVPGGWAVAGGAGRCVRG